MKAGIRQVARRAGVSPATVTRVLSGHPTVGMEITRKVQRAVAVTGYQPNRMAKGLASHRAGVIGVVMLGSGEAPLSHPHPYGKELMYSLVAQARRQNFDILIGPDSYSDGMTGMRDIKRLLQSRRVDGVIVLNSGKVVDAAFEGLDEINDPVVLIGPHRRHPHIWSVDTDHAGVAYDATCHLISRGHTHIGLVGQPLAQDYSNAWLHGYERALRRHNLKWHDEWIAAREEWPSGAYRSAVSSFMQLQSRPTALVASNDVVAWGILGALNELGYRVPEDMALVSLYNSQLAALSNPPLTSVDMDMERLGRTAVEMLIHKIGGQYDEGGQSTAGRFVIPHRLIVRESSGIL